MRPSRSTPPRRCCRGDPEAENEIKRRAEGIPLSTVLIDELRDIARAANAEFML